MRSIEDLSKKRIIETELVCKNALFLLKEGHKMMTENKQKNPLAKIDKDISIKIDKQMLDQSSQHEIEKHVIQHLNAPLRSDPWQFEGMSKDEIDEYFFRHSNQEPISNPAQDEKDCETLDEFYERTMLDTF